MNAKGVLSLAALLLSGQPAIPSLLQLLRDQYGATYQEPGVVRRRGGHTNAFYGVVQSSFFKDRLRTLAGARTLSNFRPVDDNRDGIFNDFRVGKTLPQFGALFRATPQVSIYSSFSKTFVPQRQQTADLDAIRATQGDPTSPTYRPPTVIPVKFLAADQLGQGWEAGAKLDLNDGIVLGTFSYFANKESGRLDVDTTNQVLFQLPGATVRTPGGGTRTEGIETEWVWTPKPTYQAIVSGSYFFEKNETSNPSVAQEVGSHLESVPRFTVAVWNKYTFTAGRWRGAYVGGGLSVLGESYVHPSWTVPVVSDTIALFDALIGYRTKFGHLPVDLRVNVRNITDRHYLNGTFQYGEPRTFIAAMGITY